MKREHQRSVIKNRSNSNEDDLIKGIVIEAIMNERKNDLKFIIAITGIVWIIQIGRYIIISLV